MIRIVGICLALLAIVFAVYSTIQQTQPALFFIELTTIGGKFPATAVVLITSLVLLVPLILVLFLISKLSGNKNFMPDLTGRTGLVVTRKKALYGAAYVNKVLIDGEIKSAVSNGKSTFIPLPIGKYYLQISNKKSNGIEINITGNKITNVQMSYLDEGLKAKLILEVLD